MLTVVRMVLEAAWQAGRVSEYTNFLDSANVWGKLEGIPLFMVRTEYPPFTLEIEDITDRVCDGERFDPRRDGPTSQSGHVQANF